MKYCLLIIISLLSFQSGIAQDWKKNSRDFLISQDDDDGVLAQLKVPEKAIIDGVPLYASFSQGASNLNIAYELDDDPDVTVPKTVRDGKTNLPLYARGLSDIDIAGITDIAISNKSIAPGLITINGIQVQTITYNYVHTIAGTNVTEKGKTIMYLFKVEGTSLINTEKHPIIVRLSFELEQNNGADLSKLASEIGETLRLAPKE